MKKPFAVVAVMMFVFPGAVSAFASDDAGKYTTKCMHIECGGQVTLEDDGVYCEDVWLTCQGCGKTWHPHSFKNVLDCDGILNTTRRAF